MSLPSLSLGQSAPIIWDPTNRTIYLNGHENKLRNEMDVYDAIGLELKVKKGTEEYSLTGQLTKGDSQQSVGGKQKQWYFVLNEWQSEDLNNAQQPLQFERGLQYVLTGFHNRSLQPIPPESLSQQAPLPRSSHNWRVPFQNGAQKAGNAFKAFFASLFCWIPNRCSRQSYTPIPEPVSVYNSNIPNSSSTNAPSMYDAHPNSLYSYKGIYPSLPSQ
ncbi:MAG: hypothetical protein ACPGUD_06905 [Parashewanella sp.]